ncbi:MAG: hypothetical protein GY771_05290 [bacterium]|nr:hypothetical protein [bacterium]
MTKTHKQTKGSAQMTAKATNKAKTLPGIILGVEPPSATRESRYQPLYDFLKENVSEWADVTDAIANLAKEAGGKVPSAQASAITLRNQGFEATSRKTDKGPRVFARYIPETK